MFFTISIDTEEDNWDNYQDKPSVNNIDRIPYIQKIFDKYNLKPTYLISYAVASNDISASIVKRISDSRRCEIGTHLHPWNTPPFEEKLNEKNRMLSNINKNLQYKKLRNLHKEIKNKIGIDPISFRAGRYGINNEMVSNLYKLNYKIESSITPFLDWSYYYGPDFSEFTELNPYRFKKNNIYKKDDHGEMIEAPISAGFLQSNFEFANKVFRLLKNKPIRYFKLIGLLSKLRLLNRVRLTPEGYSLNEMIKLINTMKKNKLYYFNLSFHSNTLLPGITPFVTNEYELKVFLYKIEMIIKYMIENKILPITLSEVETII